MFFVTTCLTQDSEVCQPPCTRKTLWEVSLRKQCLQYRIFTSTVLIKCKMNHVDSNQGVLTCRTSCSFKQTQLFPHEDTVADLAMHSCTQKQLRIETCRLNAIYTVLHCRCDARLGHSWPLLCGTSILGDKAPVDIFFVPL